MLGLIELIKQPGLLFSVRVTANALASRHGKFGKFVFRRRGLTEHLVGVVFIDVVNLIIVGLTMGPCVSPFINVFVILCVGLFTSYGLWPLEEDFFLHSLMRFAVRVSKWHPFNMSVLGKEHRTTFRFFVILVSASLVGFARIVLINFLAVIVELHIVRMFSSHESCYGSFITKALRECGRIDANFIAGFSWGYFVIVITDVVIVMAVIPVG